MTTIQTTVKAKTTQTMTRRKRRKERARKMTCHLAQMVSLKTANSSDPILIFIIIN